MKHLLILITLLFSTYSFSQELIGNKLLEKAIQYHDPNSKWETFNGQLSITMEIPEKPNRDSNIHINLPKEYFKIEASNGKNTTTYLLNKDNCSILYNGHTPNAQEQEKHKLTCKRAKLFKNYYTYLYGLPMKLKDPGTIVHDKVESKTFKGKTYWVLKATYSESVGKDTWYFYFDKNTYALEVYQFFHDESKNDGEYILLTGQEIINDIKMPKTRAWFMNKDNKYLGTDILKQSI